MNTILKVTAKGQVTLHKDVLRHLGAGPGDRLIVELQRGGEATLRQERAATSGIEAWFGLLHDPDGPKLPIEDIKAMTEEAWAGRREDHG